MITSQYLFVDSPKTQIFRTFFFQIKNLYITFGFLQKLNLFAYPHYKTIPPIFSKNFPSPIPPLQPFLKNLIPPL